MEFDLVPVDRGTDIHANKCFNWDILHLDSKHGHVEVDKVLFERGVDENAWDKLQADFVAPRFVGQTGGMIKCIFITPPVYIFFDRHVH